MKHYIHIHLFLTLCCVSFCARSQNSDDKATITPLDIPNLITFWDFQDTGDTGDLKSSGANTYTLEEMNGPIKRTEKGIFGPSALKIKRGQWLRIERKDCPELNIHGKQEVTVVAWIKRQAYNHWQYIAGVWNEHDAARQYALFTSGHKQSDHTTLDRTDADHQAHGYVSDAGGATNDRPFAFSYATGKTKLEYDEWYMIAFTYDQNAIKVYVNGKLDSNSNYNPFYWDKPIYEGVKNGADFTIAQRNVPSWSNYPEGMPKNKVGFGGVLGGLAVYDRAIRDNEISALYTSTMRNTVKKSKDSSLKKLEEK